MHKLLMHEVHRGCLVGHFDMRKTLKVCDICIIYRQTKCNSLHHGLYISLTIPNEPRVYFRFTKIKIWVEIQFL